MNSNIKNDEQKSEDQRVRIPVRWGKTDSLQTLYANQMFVTHGGTEFYLVFGESMPPVILDRAELPEAIEIKPLVRIAVSTERMEAFIEVLNKNFQRFRDKQQGEK